MSNLFVRLQNLLPRAPVVVARVISQDAVTDTSIVELPTGVVTEDYVAGLQTGTRFQVRGRQVAIGKMAFIRSDVIESEAPDGLIADVTIGRVVGL